MFLVVKIDNSIFRLLLYTTEQSAAQIDFSVTYIPVNWNVYQNNKIRNVF